MSVYRITARKLRSRSYCKLHIQMFSRIFPKGAPFAKATLHQANILGIDVGYVLLLVFVHNGGDDHSRDRCTCMDPYGEEYRQFRSILSAYRNRLGFVRLGFVRPGCALFEDAALHKIVDNMIDTYWANTEFRKLLREDIAVKRRS